MRSHHTRGMKLLAILFALAFVAAGCSSDDDSGGGGGGGGGAGGDCLDGVVAEGGGTETDDEGDGAEGEGSEGEGSEGEGSEGEGSEGEGSEGEGSDDEGSEGEGDTSPGEAIASLPDPSIEVSAPAGGDLNLAIEQEPTGLNHLTAADNAAWTAWAISDTHWRGAVYPEPDGTLVRNTHLVDSVELVSEDPQVVVYEIRDDANWSDGTPVTADDFAFMQEAQSDPEAASAPAGTQGYQDMESVEGSNDGKTVTVTYARPYADWQALFDYVFPAHYFSEVGDGDPVDAFGNGFKVESLPELPLVSSGPYVLTEYSATQSLILERNDSFAGDPSGPDRVIGLFLTDSTQYPAALANQEFDVGYPQGQLDLFQQLEDDSSATTEVGFGTFWEHLDFNLENEVLAVPEVRQAIALALDREDIVASIPQQFSDEAEILNNRVFFPFQDDYVDNSGAYGSRDLDAARAILDDLGCSDGDISLRVVWRDPNPRRQQTAEIVQDQLSDLGIDVTLDPQPDFEFLDDGNFDIALFGWTGSTSLGSQTSLYTTGEGQNFARYSNPEVDQLLADAEVELDAQARADLYNQVDTILWEDLPTIPLFQNPDVLTYRTEAVEGPLYNGLSGPTWNMIGWTVR